MTNGDKKFPFPVQHFTSINPSPIQLPTVEYTLQYMQPG